MGLDITFTRRKKIHCPECGTIVGYEDVDCVDSGGRVWYDVLEHFGYYVPYEQRTKENDWYGKDMTLTDAQAEEIMQFLEKNSVFQEDAIAGLIAMAKCKGHDVVINADW